MRRRVLVIVAICSAILTAVAVSFTPLLMVVAAIADPEGDHPSSTYYPLLPLGGAAALWVLFGLAV